MSNPSTNPGTPYPDMGNAHLQVLALANELGRRAKNQMILGASLAGGGIVLTLVTYADAKPGGQYAIFWGLILVGLIRFGTAAKRHSTARSDAIAHFQDQQVGTSPQHPPAAPAANQPPRPPTLHQHRRVYVADTRPRRESLPSARFTAVCPVCGCPAGSHDAWCSRYAG